MPRQVLPPDDRAEQDAEQLVGLLFVAATPLGRSDVTNSLRISPARLARACAVLQADPPRGLRLEHAGDQLGLVSAPAFALFRADPRSETGRMSPPVSSVCRRCT